MNSGSYSRLLNFAWYQLLWFCAVLGGTQTQLLLPPLLALHLLTVQSWRSELLLILAVAALGASCDSLLSLAGYFRFESTPAGMPVPFWLVGIWMGFAATLRHSMAFMVGRPRLMSCAAALFAPLTYLAAQRLGAVEFPLGNLPTAIVIGLTWFALTPAVIRLSTRSQSWALTTSTTPLNQKEYQS